MQDFVLASKMVHTQNCTDCSYIVCRYWCVFEVYKGISLL